MKSIDHISKGNKKLPATTWIFNSGSATDCPSRQLGLCQCEDKCYAMKAERQYPACLPYRRRQFEITRTIDPSVFAADILAASIRARANRMKHFRFNESGDFVDQAQVDWFTAVCASFTRAGVKCYGYTARTDLDLTGIMRVAKVNLSNDKYRAYEYMAAGANRFRVVAEKRKGNITCLGDCRKCNLCFTLENKVIDVVVH